MQRKIRDGAPHERPDAGRRPSRRIVTGPDAVLPADDPRMIAWNKYTATEEYADAMRWALDTNVPGDRRQRYVDGALWAAFVAGFDAAEAVAQHRAAEDVESVLGLSAAASRLKEER